MAVLGSVRPAALRVRVRPPCPSSACPSVCSALLLRARVGLHLEGLAELAVARGADGARAPRHPPPPWGHVSAHPRKQTNNTTGKQTNNTPGSPKYLRLTVANKRTTKFGWRAS